ncbi:hypothetical protein [Bradyrhizobium valentinum]|nr:hypothetical protein [Bradyrhizobium valentinum]
MALAAKSPTKPDFKVPSLCEASPEYAALIARREGLFAQKATTEKEIAGLIKALRTVPPAERHSKAVAELVGDHISQSEPPRPSRERLNELQQHLNAIDKATRVVDVLISLSATSPTLPTNYTLFRRIGSMKTNGSAQWTLFVQSGDEFLWAVAVQDLSTSGSALYGPTLSVPTGVSVWALHSILINNAITTDSAIVYAQVAENDPGAINAFQRAVTQQVTAISVNGGWLQTRTDTSATIRIRVGLAATTVIVGTRGWIDRRGRDN